MRHTDAKRRSAMERWSPRLSNSDRGERDMGTRHGYRLILTSKWRKSKRFFPPKERFFPSAWKKIPSKKENKTFNLKCVVSHIGDEDHVIIISIMHTWEMARSSPDAIGKHFQINTAETLPALTSTIMTKDKDKETHNFKSKRLWKGR